MDAHLLRVLQTRGLICAVGIYESQSQAWARLTANVGASVISVNPRNACSPPCYPQPQPSLWGTAAVGVVTRSGVAQVQTCGFTDVKSRLL